MNEYPYEPDKFDVEADQALARGLGAGAHRAEDSYVHRNLRYIVLAACALIAIILGLWFIQGLAKGPDYTPVAATSAASDAGAAKKPSGAATTTQAAAASKQASATPSQTATTTKAPAVDKNAAVQVLNGTRIKGLAAKWRDAMKAQGWTTITVDTTKAQQDAGVYYKNDSDLGTATQLAKYLGVEPVKSADYSSNITVVVTQDPGDLAASEIKQ